MFTGIVEELGTVVELRRLAEGPQAAARLSVCAAEVTSDLAPGDSVAVNGACLTVADTGGDTSGATIGSTFTADVMGETLSRTTVGDLVPGAVVNLERAAKLGSRLGGHLVQGHVDGTGVVAAREPSAHWDLVRIGLPGELARFVVEKGSIAVDGVSLTVVEVSDIEVSDKDDNADEHDDELTGAGITVGLIPETLARTTLGTRRPGDRVNLEVDVMAKYVQRLLGRWAQVAP